MSRNEIHPFGKIFSQICASINDQCNQYKKKDPSKESLARIMNFLYSEVGKFSPFLNMLRQLDILFRGILNTWPIYKEISDKGEAIKDFY